MTSIKMLALLGLHVGLALLLTTGAGADHSRPPKRSLGELSVFDGKDFFGQVVRDGDRFVAIRALIGEDKLGYLHNFDPSIDLEVDDKYLGYDLGGKNKKVLVRERSGDDTRWIFIRSEANSPFFGYFRVNNGDLKGWWIGLEPVEPAKKGGRSPRDQYPRAPMVLVKDKKDAAGFRWTTPKDEESR